MAAVPNAAAANPDRVYGVSNIKSHIPVVLDLEESNYDAWRELFHTHCLCFDVLGHIDGTTLPTDDNDMAWKKRDGIVKLWLYGTLSPKLFQSSFVTGSSSRDIWLKIENQFRNNKEARALRLDNELRTKEIGDLKVIDYCQQMKKLADSLNNVDAPVQDKTLVMYVLNGLNAKFDNIINVIKHQKPFPCYDDAVAMLEDEENRLKRSIKPVLTPTDHSSSSTVLNVNEAQSQNVQRTTNQQNNRGRGRGNNRGRGKGRNNSQRPPTPNQGYPSYGPPMWSPSYPMWQPPYGYAAPYGILGPRPTQPLSSPNNNSTGANRFEHTADYTQAFNALTLQDPSDNQWYMDSGATSHITSGTGSSHQGDTSPQ